MSESHRALRVGSGATLATIVGADEADQIGLAAAAGFPEDLLYLREGGADRDVAPLRALMPQFMSRCRTAAAASL